MKIRVEVYEGEVVNNEFTRGRVKFEFIAEADYTNELDSKILELIEEKFEDPLNASDALYYNADTGEKLPEEWRDIWENFDEAED